MGKVASKLASEIVNVLQNKTLYDKKEIQELYENFIDQVPEGFITKETLLSWYEEYFPFGDSAPFLSYYFPMVDLDGDGVFSFSDWLECLSIISRGRLDDRTRMLGDLTDLKIESDSPEGRAERIFTELKEYDGIEKKYIILDDFIKLTHTNPDLIQGFLLFDGIA